MKKTLVALALAFAAAGTLSAAPPGRPEGRVDIEIRPSIKGAVLTRADGEKPADRLQWVFPASDAWTARTLRFTPSHDCTIRLRLKSRFDGLEKPVWMLYDALSADGMPLVNGDFEQQPTSKTGWILEQQVEGQGASWLTISGLARQGRGCVRVWHNGPATQQGIALKAGREVTLALHARRAPELVPPADPVEAAKFKPFDFSLPALAAKHPEIRLVDRIVASMKDVPPIAPRLGERNGLPAIWLNGDWQFLPMPSLPEAIAQNRLFVPSLLSRSFALREAYAPAPADWHDASKLWYSVNVDIPEAWRDSPVVLRFGAVDFLGAVFINGRHAATHAGRYTPFEVPLAADDISAGRVNVSVFVLKCDYAIADGVSWFQLGSSYRSKPIPGGIAAPVCLYRDTPVGIQNVRIVTTLAPSRLAVSCTTKAQPPDVEIEPVVVDADGGTVLTLPRKPAAASLKWEAAWENPTPWSHERPHLYQIRFDLHRAGTRLAEAHAERFGFREVKVEGRKILVNGIPVRLFGVSVGQQSNAAFCRADEDFSYRYFRILREKFHINALRFHHTPAFEAQIRAADRAGMLVINQSGVWTSARDLNYRGGNDTLANLEREFGEWIGRDRNSPSTIIWDTANEYIAGSPGFSDFWRKFDDIARKLDPTRIVQQSASGPFDDRGETCHLHTGYYSNARGHRSLPARVEKPVIFGEFLSPKDLEAPRWVGDEKGLNATYIKTFEDRLAEYRLSDATGIFPFYSIEDAFTLESKIPEGTDFAPESFNPKRLYDSYIVNPYADIDAQVDPAFVAMANRVFAPVAALWRERSHHFKAGSAALRTLRVANDSLASIDAKVSVTLDDRELHRVRLALNPGQWRDVAVPIPADASSGTLAAKVVYGDKEYVNEKPCTVVAPAKGDGARIWLHGGSPAMKDALAKAGYEVKTLADLTPCADGVLLVCENAVTEPGKLQTLLDRKRGAVIVLRQDTAEFSEFLGMDFIRAKGQPGTEERFVSAGLYAPAYDRALHDRGVQDYDNPGGTDASYFDTYAVPMHNGLTPPNVTILFGGRRPHHVPCLRYALADGNYIFCQMPLEKHLLHDGRAMPILQRLIDLAVEPRPAPADGTIFTDDDATRAALAAYGFKMTDDPTVASLAVASAAAYEKDARLNAARRVLVYGASDGEIDGKKLRVIPTAGFISFAVSPAVPGLGDLAAANFFPIVDGTINKEGGFKHPVPVVWLQDAERAVFGRKTSIRMRVYAPKSALPVMAYYKKDEADRWVCGFAAGESHVIATALSIARWLDLPFALETPRRVQDYYVIGAGDVALDGDLAEWRFDGDQTLHNWRHAMALKIGDGALFHSMEDAKNLYVAVEAAQPERLVVHCGSMRVELSPNPDGTVAVSVDGRPSAGSGKWRMADGKSILEAAVPHAEINLGQKSALRVAYGASTYPADEGSFSFRMKQPRHLGDYPAGGELAGSGKTELEIHVGQAKATELADDRLFSKQAKVTRVDITETPGKGWKIQLLTRNDIKPIKKGDLLLAVCHVRCVDPDGVLDFNLRFGQTQDKIADVPVNAQGTQWRRVYARARANKDYDVGKCVISLGLGSAAVGTYEFANLQIVNFGAEADAEGVPPSGMRHDNP
ncbi:MAG: glycoside hydrolase family 2 TIM barrel-domain containing protein [Kiritimatiellia bacterium]|jgi:hypothetical protein|uniref:glycoside hydrolase family 2 TIM barrel-domain containing protein n=1 Tax=Atribacter sp. TaxID=2847780 RepID=UPI003D988A2A